MTRSPLAAALILLALAPAALPQAEPPVILHGPLLLNPSPDGVTVVWFTDRPCASWVEYAQGENFRTFPSLGGLIQTARTSRHGLIDANATRHEVRLTGLKPGQACRYRLHSKAVLSFQPYEVVYGATAVSEIRTFRTLDPAKAGFSFVVLQDLHNNAGRLEALSARTSAAAADLVFLNGDNAADPGREADIFAGLFDPAARAFAAASPLVLIRGNHETRGAMARRLEEFFPTPAGRYYYAFSHGPVRFVVLDSGEDKPDDSPVYAGLADFDRYRAEQAEWLKSEVRSEAFRRAGFRVVFSHIPPFGDGFAARKIAELWLPILNKAGADLLIGGHYHTLYNNAPRPAGAAFPVLGAPPDAAIRAEVTAGSVSLQVIDAEGTVRDKLIVAARPGRR
jgi:hypothetical protein